MTNKMPTKQIKGISACNPVCIDRDYLLYTVDYAATNGFNHLQIIGPIHDYVKGNIDGMIRYRKYEQFNYEKDGEYVDHCTEVVNETCDRAHENNIEIYMWHHELYLPCDFKDTYPEILNEFKDVEITHPLVKDFLENKICDFFNTYPNIDGIILTLHETSIPILKLKGQKLGAVDRVKYIVKILYDSCVRLGKELVVRPFASIEEDYIMLMDAYEHISTDMPVMDKWTQFDWSLTMPSNRFYNKIKNNPLIVEADIFGEFFGKGRLPLMLDKHIRQKFEYCETFNPIGYVARIDRNGQILFGDVNQVNIDIMNAWLNKNDVMPVIYDFFEKKYPGAAQEIYDLMKETEEILKKTLYIKGYLFSELSIFPTLNHCKNHYYFEMMRKDSNIDSCEWYIPLDWKGYTTDEILNEKQEAVDSAELLLKRLNRIKDKVEESEYKKLWVKFCNLNLVTKIWQSLAMVLIDYVRYFETKDESYAISFNENLNRMVSLSNRGKELLGDMFYCLLGNDKVNDFVDDFVTDICENFEAEKRVKDKMDVENDVLDYIICGGALEGHQLQKEVNFSDSVLRNGEPCRIPGNSVGTQWSSVNSHGWFSYLIKIKPNSENKIKIIMENSDGEIDCYITIGDEKYTIHEKTTSKKEITLKYFESHGDNYVRIRFDRNSRYVPFVYRIIVTK